LISAIPENREDKLYSIKGTPPDMSNLPLGDPFAPRNEYALEIDFEKEPSFYQISPTHFVKSELLNEHSQKVTPPKVIEKL